jgi:hypothetical protein
MAMALNLGWPPSEIRALSQRDLRALDLEIRKKNREDKRKR